MPFFNKSFVTYLYQWLTAPNGDYVHHCKTNDVQQNNEDDVAIYCIHGTADQSSAFSIIAENIRPELSASVKSIHQPSFEGRFQLHDISFFACQLKDKILANPHKKIILIGHSRGALVASYFTENLAEEYGIQVKATINICGPFCGSKWAVFPFTCSESINQMRLDSPFLDALRKQMTNSGNTYYYFTGSRDDLVNPSHAFIEEHAQNVIELDEDHLSIMKSPSLINHLKNIIHQVIQKNHLATSEEKSNGMSLNTEPKSNYKKNCSPS